MKETIREIERLARKRIEATDATETAAQIAEKSSAAPKTPFRARGVSFTEEGIETPYGTGKPVGVDFPLPAKTLRWSLRPGLFRVTLRLAEPSVVNVFDEGSGAQVVRNRRTGRFALLDLKTANARIESTSRITGADIRRIDGRVGGEVVLGPFPAKGIVEAEAIGHGDWTAEVASDPLIPGRLDLEGTPAFTPMGSPWRGTPPDEDQPEPPEKVTPGETLRMSVASRFPGGPRRKLQFHPSVRAGRLRHSHEEVSVGSARRAGDAFYWGGIGKWKVLGASEAPAFDPSPSLWTVAYGRPEGHDRAYDLVSGRRAEGTEKGAYLLRSADPSDVSVEGAVTREGAPRHGSDTLTPGTYWRHAATEAPSHIFLRLKGKGTLRAAEITETRRRGPKGMEVSETRRIDLADYFRPGEDDSHNLTQSGRGTFLPGTAQREQ